MLKSLKSLFIIEEPDTDRKEDKKVAPKVTTTQTATVKETITGAPGKVTSQFTEVLLSAMEKANLQGFDYIEYKKSLQSLAAMNMDEPTRYKSAFAMAQTMGVSPTTLVSTAQHYVQALTKEEKQFEQALAMQKEKQVSTKIQEIQQLSQLVEQKNKQVQQLMQEMEMHHKQVEELKKQVNEASQKIDSTQNDFTASYNALVKTIEQDIEKMKQYL
jgi:predicted  nucleic acid-binding Zn-ribbon protein